MRSYLGGDGEGTVGWRDKTRGVANLEVKYKEGFRKEEIEVIPESNAASGSQKMTAEEPPSGTRSSLSGVEGWIPVEKVLKRVGNSESVQIFVLNFVWKGSRENGAGGNAIH